MATILATVNGNWNATGTWVGGVVPTTGDIVYANNKTITVNVNATVAEVRTDAGGGATAGGTFNLADGVTLSADSYAGATPCVNYIRSEVAYFIGNGYAGSGGSSAAVKMGGSGIFNVTGNFQGGTGIYASGAALSSGTGTLNITGNCTAGTGVQAAGVDNRGLGTINITGSVTASPLVSTGYGAHNVSVGTIIINGISCASGVADGARNAGEGTLRVDVAQGASGGVDTSVFGINGMSSTSTTIVREARYGPQGQPPTGGYVRFTNTTGNKILVIRESLATGVLLNLDSVSGELPAIANVRAGVSYNSGAKTGTLVVPLPANVRQGVSTDNTTGTGTITAVELVAELNASSLDLAVRLRNVSTPATTGAQLAALL